MRDLTLSQRLAAFAAASTVRHLPAEVARSAIERILDTLGICIAASTLPTSRAAIGWAAAQGGTPEASAVGIVERLPASSAAFVNGVLAHSLDYDDTHLPSVLHPSASVLPAALSAAEAVGAGGAQLMAAAAVGLEVCVRIGMAGYDRELGNSVFFEHGQHATSICGTIGAAVAAGMLYGLDEGGLCDVIGVAASLGSGVIEANRTGGTVKRVHCGWAAHAGVSAAQLVARGFTGPPTVLEGRFGFFEAWLRGEYDEQALLEGLGERWEVPKIFFKPYPANHFTHAIIDASIALRDRGIRSSDILAVTVGVPRATLRTVGEPIELKRAPETGYMAQFSAPFMVAAAFLRGSGLGIGLRDVTDANARDPELRALMSRVDVVADPRCDEIFPHQFPAVVTVDLVDGRRIEEAVLANRGGPGRPLSFDELSRKFEDNASPLLDAGTVARVRNAVAALEHGGSLDAVLSPLRAVPHETIQEGTHV